MEQIKTLQQEKDDGNWENLDEEAKKQVQEILFIL